MICKKCGNEVANDQLTCSHCGAALGENVQPQFQPQAPAKVKKPVYKKWWFWVLIVFAVIFIISLGSGDEEPTKEVNAGSTQAQTEAAETTFGLNETAVFSDLKMTATEIDESRGNEFNRPSDGNIFVGIKFTIENISDEEQFVSSLLLFESYADDVKSAYSISAEIAFPDGTIDGNLAPGKKLVGWYALEAPEDWEEIELNVRSSWLSSSQAVFVFNN